MTRIAIAGFGFMGRMHYGNWKRIRGAKVVAICDANLGQLKTVAGGNLAGADTSTDFTGVAVYDDYARMLAAGGFDAVDLTLPTPLHRDLSVAALKAGYHVLCEKPMALSTADCDAMLAAARRAKRTLLVAQCLRFWPEYVALRKLILSGKYGRVVAAEFHRSSNPPEAKGGHAWYLDAKQSGGCLLDLHIHDADMIQFLFGKPRGVAARTHRRADGVLDHAHLVYDYPDMVVSATASWSNAKTLGFEASFRVTLEKASVVFDPKRPEPYLVYPAAGKPFAPKVPKTGAYEAEQRYFVDLLAGRADASLLTARDARDAVALVERAARTQSARRGPARNSIVGRHLMRMAYIVVGIALCAGAVCAGRPKDFDFAAEAAKGNVRLVGGVYTNASEAARQVTGDADGLRFRFDPLQMAPGPRWCTVDVRGDLQPGDWLGSRVRLVMRRRPFRNVTRQMAVNFTDRDGETFQYLPSQVEQMPSENLLACTFEVRTAHNGCWGGGDRANKVPDPPLRFTSLNGHFASGGRYAEMTLVRFEVLPPVTPQARTVSYRAPVSVDTTYPGAAPFPAADELVFRLPSGTEGGMTLTLSANSKGSVGQGERLRFQGRAVGQEVRFATDLPYDGRYSFLSLTCGDVALRPVSAEGLFRRPAAEVPELDVETGNRLHLVRREKPGERAVVTVRNPAQREMSWKGALRFSDVFGREIRRPLDLTVPAGGTVRLDAPELPAKGLWFVDAEVTGPDGSTARKSTRFAVVDLHERTPVVEKPAFRFGIHYHGTYYLPDLVDPTIDALVAAGAKFTRTDYSFMFADIARPDGSRDWSKSDDLLKRLRDAGLALEIIVGGTPRWAVDPEVLKARAGLRRPGCLPSRPGLFRAFCRDFAARYGRQIDYYEIGNEWDLTSPDLLKPDEALRMQREAYEGVHAGFPAACVTPNGWAGASSRRLTSPKDNPGLIETFAEHPELYDAWALHCHGAFEDYVARIQDEFLPLRAKTGLGTRPWISGETAQTTFGGDEIRVARTVWAKTLYAWAWGARDYIWYNLRATGWLEGSEPGYGLMTASLHPRAGYASFAALTAIFQGLAFDARLVSRDNLHLFRYKGEKGAFRGVVLAGWDWDAETPRTVRIRTDAACAERSDYMGNRTPVPVVDGVVTFALGADPQALLLPGAARAEMLLE